MIRYLQAMSAFAIMLGCISNAKADVYTVCFG